MVIPVELRPNCNFADFFRVVQDLQNTVNAEPWQEFGPATMFFGGIYGTLTAEQSRAQISVSPAEPWMMDLERSNGQPVYRRADWSSLSPFLVPPLADIAEQVP